MTGQAWTAQDVNLLVAGSCLIWTATAAGVYRLLEIYLGVISSMTLKDRLSWANRITSGIHVSYVEPSCCCLSKQSTVLLSGLPTNKHLPK